MRPGYAGRRKSSTCTMARFPAQTVLVNLQSFSIGVAVLTSSLQDLSGALRAIGECEGDNLIVGWVFDLERELERAHFQNFRREAEHCRG